MMIGIIILTIAVLYMASWVKILAEYERAVIFRLGRVLPRTKGPGLIFVCRPWDRMLRTSLRVEAMEVPPQDVVTRDNVSVRVNDVVYIQDIDPINAVIVVNKYRYSTSQVRKLPCAACSGRLNSTSYSVSGKDSTHACKRSWTDTPVPGA